MGSRRKKKGRGWIQTLYFFGERQPPPYKGIRPFTEKGRMRYNIQQYHKREEKKNARGMVTALEGEDFQRGGWLAWKSWILSPGLTGKRALQSPLREGGQIFGVERAYASSKNKNMTPISKPTFALTLKKISGHYNCGTAAPLNRLSDSIKKDTSRPNEQYIRKTPSTERTEGKDLSPGPREDRAGVGVGENWEVGQDDESNF